MKTLTIFLLLFLTATFIFGQSLEELRESYKSENEQRIERVVDYASKKQIPIIQQLPSGVTICLQDVVNGVPQYIKTHNTGAAATTGANKLGIDGSLGLDLDGAGVNIAIWDGGLVRTTHDELVGRIIPSDASPSLNFHATHVAGTILSKGITSNAKGMAINAQARTFDFNNDNGEMLQYAQSGQGGTILSNHSYGSISGWDDGVWYGDENISELEDWKFGFYTGGAASWDNIAYNSPYYTIVKSAGNDRGDSGNGTHPADGPYDIISTSGTAKNIITIGAVNKVASYSGPLDVVMSSFSGWGPTDDGRIKPDFVAAGVSLFSTFETANNAYGTLSGTSMSAPNATGTFALLQQLNKNLTGSYMKSALLKGLVAHTASEAGSSNGPDYSFGWGLVNGVGAADLLIKDNGLDKRIEEINLLNGQSYELNLSPVNGQRVKATICWTDPAGIVPPISLDPTNLILVNDLDLRIASTDETQMPWILNPASPGAAASKGDNFRDNIEVIEFTATSEDYTLTISHKNSLTNGHQDVFLILTYEDINNTTTSQYWIGDDGDFSMAANWSSETGGSGNGQAPSALTSLIFDNNSFSPESSEIVLGISANTSLKDFIYLSDKPVIFDIGSNDLTIAGKFSTNNKIQFQGSGRILFDSENSVTLSSQFSLSEMEVVFNNQDGEWLINGDFNAKTIDLNAGHLNFGGNEVSVDQFVVNNSNDKILTIDNSRLLIRNNALFHSTGLSYSDSGAEIVLEGSAVTLSGDDITSLSSLIVTGQSIVNGFSSFSSIELDGDLAVETSLEVSDFVSYYGSNLELSTDVQIAIDDIEISGSNEEFFNISSSGLANIQIQGHRKICLDKLSITNVNLIGGATVAVGTESTLDNSTGWRNVSCEDALFSDFAQSYTCTNSLVYFSNLSEGSFTDILWDFDGLGTSEDSNPYFIFDDSGTYTVTLVVSSGSNSSTYSQEVVISENALDPAEISIVGEVLFSTPAADSYQWYKDGQPLEGETNRFYKFGNEIGEIFVVLFYETCNIPSNTIELVVAGIGGSNELQLYPNPASGILNIKTVTDNFEIDVFDGSGRKVRSLANNGNKSQQHDVSDFEPGIYILRFRSGNRYIFSKIVVE